MGYDVPDWYLTKDGDRACLELYERHYSANVYADGRERSQFVGPGEHIVLRTFDADALFVWRRGLGEADFRYSLCRVEPRNDPSGTHQMVFCDAARKFGRTCGPAGTLWESEWERMLAESRARQSA